VITVKASTTLGIDLGTSELKVLLLGEDGAVITTGHAPLAWSQPHIGWAEQDPHSWWLALLDACAQTRQAAPEHYSKVRAIGLSGQMHGATLLDERQQVLRPCILWNDGRSEAQCAQLLRNCPELHEIAGNLAMPGFTAPKLLWLREHEPDLFSRVATVLLPKDYLRWLLTGNMVSEMSDAAGTLWLDVARRDWSDLVLQATGLNRGQMPQLIEGSAISGALSPNAAQQLGLPSGIPVAGGAGDNAASAIGIGAVSAGDSFVSLGTSGVLFSVTDKHRPNVQDAVHAFCHALPGVWHQMTVMLTAASALRWITQSTGQHNEAELLAAVAELSDNERASAPIFLPYLSGERTPHNDVSASGAFVGLRHSHHAAHLAFSVIDGVCLGMRDGLDALQRAGTHISEVQLVGGGSRSTLWAQLLADALSLRVVIGEASSVGAALGAARLAQLCEGEASAIRIKRICQAPKTTHTCAPQAAGMQAAQRRQALFRATYQSLRPVMRAQVA
jgi:xylulokinase